MIKQAAIRLVDAGWDRELSEAIRADSSEVHIVCPFIKKGALDCLLSHRPRNLQVITRFNLADFAEGVSDIEALRLLLEAGAGIRGIGDLHAKLYLFGTSRAIITSANLTRAALTRNHEFGMVADDAAVIAACRDYFDGLWRRAGAGLSRDMLDSWEETVTRYCAASGRPNRASGLDDFGADSGIVAKLPVSLPPVVADADQAFVKFLGEGHNRVPISCTTLEEIKETDCHWALPYPANRRPRGVKDGAVMFIARLTDEPDIRIFGRAIAMKHDPDRDNASREDIARRSWKEKGIIYNSNQNLLTGPVASG